MDIPFLEGEKSNRIQYSPLIILKCHTGTWAVIVLPKNLRNAQMRDVKIGMKTHSNCLENKNVLFKIPTSNAISI